MNMTSVGWPRKSLNETVWASTLMSENSGAGVPSWRMVLAVLTMEMLRLMRGFGTVNRIGDLQTVVGPKRRMLGCY
jgi:hypothetical protein